MRLVHTTQYYWPYPGGAEVYCQAVSEALACDHEVEVCTTDVISANPLLRSISKVEVKNGVKINRLSSINFLARIYGHKSLDGGSSALFRTLSSMDTQLTWPQALVERGISSSVPHSFLWLNHQLKTADTAVIFNVITGMTSLSYLSCLLNNKKFVLFPMYHVGLPTYERPSLLKIVQRATLTICSTEFERQALIKRGLEQSKLRVVNEGANKPAVDKNVVDYLRQVFNRRENELVLMYVGRRDYDKGYSHVLSAAYQLVKRGLPIKLVICGYGKTGNDRSDYLYLLKHNAMIDLGVAEENAKFAAMSLADVIVLPSRAETYPLVFVEAWLLGKPVIGARIGSVACMVREGIDGLLIDFGDISSLMAAIESLQKSPDKIATMGQQGRSRASKELTFDKTAEKVRKIFNELSN